MCSMVYILILEGVTKVTFCRPMLPFCVKLCRIFENLSVHFNYYNYYKPLIILNISIKLQRKINIFRFIIMNNRE